MVGSALRIVGLTGDALSSVPGCVVTLAAVDVVRTSSNLTLAEILYCAKVVSCNGFHIFNDFLNNDGFGVCIFDSLVLNSLLGSVQEALLAKAEAMSSRLALDDRVCVPVILTLALLSREVVAVGTFVHLSVFRGFGRGTTSWVQKLFSVDAVLGGKTEANLALISLLWPFVLTIVTLTQRFSLHRVVLAFHSIVEFISEAAKVLSLNHDVNVV